MCLTAPGINKECIFLLQQLELKAGQFNATVRIVRGDMSRVN